MVGAERRLATDAVVMKARVIQEMYVGFGMAPTAALPATVGPVGTSVAVISDPPGRWTSTADGPGCAKAQARPSARRTQRQVHEGPARHPVRVRAPRASGQDTIAISWLVLFRRRPPSAVTVTMSSMRTPKRPGR